MIGRIEKDSFRVALNLRSKGRGPGQEGRLEDCQGIGDFDDIVIIQS